MIIKQKYETRMTPNEIESWIQRKKGEETGLIIKIRKYVARSNQNGFMIREKRLNNYQSFMPRIIGKYTSTLKTTKIDLKIIPSYTGIIFFSIFLLGFPIAILSNHSVKINGAMTSDLNDKLVTVGVILLIVFRLCYGH